MQRATKSSKASLKKAQTKVQKVQKRKIATKKVVTKSKSLLSTPSKFSFTQLPTLSFARKFSTLNTPGSILYSKEHEYLRFDTPTTAFVGISNHAQELLGDIVYVDLPQIGATASAGSGFAAVESVKASNDVFAPASLKVLKVNSKVTDEPSLVNTDPEGEGWFAHVEVVDTGDFAKLMDKNAYASYLETCDH